MQGLYKGKGWVTFGSVEGGCGVSRLGLQLVMERQLDAKRPAEGNTTCTTSTLRPATN